MAKVFAPRKIIATIRKRKHITDAHREELERLIAETDNYNHFTEKQKKDLIYLNRKSQRTHNYHAKLHMRGKKTKMKKGGKVVDDNTAMVLSQNKAIAHHTEELKKALNKNERVDAWVVGKIERASTDISDVTHYLDGKTEYADGGDVQSKYVVVETDKTGNKRVMGRYNDLMSAEVYAMMKNDFMMKGRSVSIEDAEGKVVKKFEKGGAVELKPLLDKDGTRRIDAKAIDRLEMLARELPQTKYMHLDKNGRYVPKRKQLHKKIVDGFIKNKPCVTNRQPIAILTGGAPASGKSTFIKKYVDLDPEKVYHVDADEVRAMLPEYKGWNASQTHLETSDIVTKLIDTIGEPCEFDLIYDGTMNRADKYTDLVNKLHRLGYKVFIIYISIPKELSIERSRARYQSSGRYVPKEVIDKVYESGLDAFEDVAKNMADGYVRIDGVSGDIIEKGGMEMPKNIEYAKGGKIGFEGLSNKVAKNYEGKAVKPEYQKLYGKTYSKEEAKEVGDKVASKVYRQQLAKMEMGGEVGDNALVLSANKMGYIVEVGKDTYTLRFPDGTQSVFRENELQIMNDDDYFANGGETNKQWVVYVDNDQRIVGTYDSERSAKMAMNKLWNTNEYESIGMGLKSDAYSDEYYAKGGATSSYNYGRSWHMDKRKFNKSESYELPIVSRKKAMGGYMADGGELKKGDKIVVLGKEFEFVRHEMDSSQGYDEERVILKDKDGIRSYPKDMVEAYSQYKMADGGHIKGDSLQDVRNDAKTYSRNSKQDVYVLEEKRYEFVNDDDKKIVTQFTMATQEDIDYIKEMPKNRLLVSFKILGKYSNGELKSSEEEVLFADGGETSKRYFLSEEDDDGFYYIMDSQTMKKAPNTILEREDVKGWGKIKNKFIKTRQKYGSQLTTRDAKHIITILNGDSYADGGETDSPRYNIVDEGKVVETNVTQKGVIDYANTIAFYDLMDESDMGEVQEIADFDEAVNYLGMLEVEVVQLGADGMSLQKKNLYTIENLGTLTDEVEFILEVNSVEFNKKDDSIVAVTTESKIKLVVSDIEDIDEPEAKDIVVRTANKVLHGTYKEPTKKKFTEGMSEKTAERMLRKLGVVGNAPMSAEQKAKKDEKNAMILFTTEIDKKLFEQYKYGADMDKQDVVVKIFNPYGRGTWYVMNADPEDPDYLWGIVDLFDVEMGSMSRDELVSLRIPPLGVRLERDLSFKPINAKELFERLQDGEQFKFGGNIEYKQKDFDNTIQ